MSSKTTEGKEEEEVTVSLAVAKEIRMNAAVAAVLSKVDGIFALNVEQRTAVMVKRFF